MEKCVAYIFHTRTKLHDKHFFRRKFEIRKKYQIGFKLKIKLEAVFVT